MLTVVEFAGIVLDSADLMKAVAMRSNGFTDDELKSVLGGTSLAAVLVK